MVSRYTIDVTSDRIFEMQQAIVEQRYRVAGTIDPVARVTAARTLATLEDILLIMQRTQGLLVDTTRGQLSSEA